MTATTGTMNNTHGKWPEIKGDIRKSWNKITEADLENTKGDIKQISTLLQKSYGQTPDSYSKPLSDIFQRFEEKTAPAEAAKASVTEVAKAPLKN